MDFMIFLLLLGINGATGVSHSLKYFYTGSSGVPNFPEFVVVGLVDEVEMIHYDSDNGRAEAKQDWMSKVTSDDPQYWERQTEGLSGTHQTFKGNIEIVKQRFNQTGGVHILQRMYGCEWDDENDEVTAYEQHGYDGEDFLSFHLKTETWIAPTQQAVITKLKFDHDKTFIAWTKNYLTQICPQWVKKYVNYGRRSLLRTDRPSVSLLQKSPSSPVSCHATGFYPDRATMFWRKDGGTLYEDVDHGEILPNHDGTFQMSMKLDVSSVKPEDWRRYDCVFQLSGVEDDIITKLDKPVIRTNWEKPSDMFIPIIAAGAVLLLLLLLLVVIGFVMYKVKKAKSSAQKRSSNSSPAVSVCSNTPLSPELKTPPDNDPSRPPNTSVSERSSNISPPGSVCSTSPLMTE